MLNALADLERHGGLKFQGRPRLLDNVYAHDVVESILKTKLRNHTKIAVLVTVEQDSTLSILKIQKIHPPAHVVVISEEYPEYESLKLKMKTEPPFKGYHSHKTDKKK